jgi:ATP dependent DNA ligase domain
MRPNPCHYARMAALPRRANGDRPGWTSTANDLHDRPSGFSRPFSDPKWLFEPKWDGYRAICYIDQSVRLISRRKNDLTKRVPELQNIQVKADTAIIDGEITAIDEEGLPRFDELRKTRRSCAVVFYAFDLLALNGEDLRGLPLLKRKAMLKRILPRRKPIEFDLRITLSAKGSRYSLSLRDGRSKAWSQIRSILNTWAVELETG